MASLAAGFIVCVKLSVAFAQPAAVIYVMKAMGAIDGQRQAALDMANPTLDYLAGIALKRLGGHVVIGRLVGDRPLGVGAAMTVFAANAPMPFAEAVESVVLLGKALVGGEQG